ncbi:unnamed protein product [Prunus armeniaca]|uniref:F-box associated beta-propeller type 1 domain-containing protein n=1 Tax=Prunus armeniaca TaxID=36596 RepID=A0A6J5X4B6_PRUAR|nr:unnamed protein product [Prunus armeniaca]
MAYYCACYITAVSIWLTLQQENPRNLQRYHMSEKGIIPAALVLVLITPRCVHFENWLLANDSKAISLQMRYPYKFDRMQKGVLLNGALHWLLMDRVGVEHQSSVIISFNLAEENVREIPLPLASIDTRNYIVGAFRDCLCLIHSGVDGGMHNEFWIMKEYGVRESWTKIRSPIPYSVVRHSGFWKKSHDP